MGSVLMRGLGIELATPVVIRLAISMRMGIVALVARVVGALAISYARRTRCKVAGLPAGSLLKERRFSRLRIMERRLARCRRHITPP